MLTDTLLCCYCTTGWLSCRPDAGFTHQPRGLYAQMVLGESFEGLNLTTADFLAATAPGATATVAPTPPGSSRNPWSPFAAPTAHATAAIDTSVKFHGQASLMLTYTGGTGAAGLANRGLAHEGLVFEASKAYDGYFFAQSEKPVNFTVSLYDYTQQTALATQSVAFDGGAWTRLNFSFSSTRAGTTCTVVNASAKPPDPDVTCGPGLCVKCGGEFRVGLASAGVAHIDYVYLQPGKHHHQLSASASAQPRD
eukprot:COSAG06_NODE_4955_length_3833_cov_2.419657_2_plen_252_part_00